MQTESASLTPAVHGTNWPTCTFDVCAIGISWEPKGRVAPDTRNLVVTARIKLPDTEFEIRMFDKHGECLRPLIVHAEDELEARIMAVEFCSEFNAGSFEVIPCNAHCPV